MEAVRQPHQISVREREHEARLMPDDCHDYCAKTGILSIYFPFHWCHGVAWYQCSEGHLWTCGWGVGQTEGSSPRNAGRPIDRFPAS